MTVKTVALIPGDKNELSSVIGRQMSLTDPKSNGVTWVHEALPDLGLQAHQSTASIVAEAEVPISSRQDLTLAHPG